jgi:NAD(P)H-dependent flavin oxidoreductase YrpB (nitropropane dioxygenase family)
VLGTRFLMTPESGAHPGYRERLTTARETLLTELFGMAWPARHRVVENDALRRWRGHERAVGVLNRVTAPLAARAPDALQARLAAAQRPGLPLLSPFAPTEGGPPGLLESGPLYAGETVARIDDVRPAGELVRALTP